VHTTKAFNNIFKPTIMRTILLNSVLPGLLAICTLFACSKTPEPTPTVTDNRPTISFNVNGIASDFKVGALLVTDSNTISLGFEYIVYPGPNYSISIYNIPNQIGTHPITKNSYPSFDIIGNLFVLSGDAVYDTYVVLENATNSITIVANDTSKQQITCNIKCTFVRETQDPKNHSFPDTITIEKTGFMLPYKTS